MRIVTTPPEMTAALSDWVAIAACRPSPTNAPTKPTRVPRRNTGPTLSTPTSSVIHAWNAPLMNVYPKPQKPQAAIATVGSFVTPTITIASPWSTKLRMIDARRLYVSASTPVGISDTKTVASITVPIRISCSGDMCRSLTRCTAVNTKAGIAVKNSMP